MFGKKKKSQFGHTPAGYLQEAESLLNEVEADRVKKSPTHRREQSIYKKSLQEAEALLNAVEARRPIAQSARKRVPLILQGLQLDGRDADDELIIRLAQLGAEGYRHDHIHRDPNLVAEVFQDEYREGLGKRTFLNPFTGECEDA